MAVCGFCDIEEVWHVDSALELPQTLPAAILTPGKFGGSSVTFTTDVSVFTAADVGKIIRGGGGKGKVVSFVSGTEITVDITRSFTHVIPQDDLSGLQTILNRPLSIIAGQWTLDTPVTVISGLGHLEGEVVTGVMDGNVITPQKVINGKITLETAATRVIVGLGYECLMQTLPPTTQETTIEARRKRLVGTGIRVAVTRGLKHGATLDAMYEMKDRTIESYGEAIPLLNKMEYIIIEDDFDENGQTFYQQTYPLPATILGHVFDIEVGDDSN